MNSSRFAQSPTKDPAPAAAIPTEGLAAAWNRFWFAPVDPVGLHGLRLLTGLLLLFWLLPFAGQLESLFGQNGWFDESAYRQASHLQGLPPHLFSWSILYLYWGSPALLTAIYWLAPVAVVLFTLGIWTRVTSVLTYVVAVSFTANPATAYDADPLLVMLAFYLMVGYLLYRLKRPGQSLISRLLGSPDAWLFHRASPFGKETPPASAAANLSVRLLQVHFAIVMTASALHKLQIQEWWSGLAAWFYLHPPFHTTAADLREVASYAEFYMTALSLASCAALAWQLGFPVFAWRPRWRPLLLGGAALAWLTDVFVLRLPLLGPIMVIGCISCSPEEWRRLARIVTRLLQTPRRLLRFSKVSSGPGAVGENETSAVSVGHSR